MRDDGGGATVVGVGYGLLAVVKALGIRHCGVDWKWKA